MFISMFIKNGVKKQDYYIKKEMLKNIGIFIHKEIDLLHLLVVFYIFQILKLKKEIKMWIILEK